MRKFSKNRGADSAWMHRLSNRSQFGVTLLELLFVVAVLGIVASMSVPYYLGYQRNYSIRNDANSISNLMLVARMRATADFARTAVSCNSSVTPTVCRLYTLQYSGASACPLPALNTWTLEPQQYILSASDTFHIPTAATYGVQGQSATAPAEVYTGQTNPYTIYFNSRGWPIATDCTLESNYALYLQDSPGVFSMAIGVMGPGAPRFTN